MDLRIREWEKLKYHDPEIVLRDLRRIEYELIEHPERFGEITPRERNLRTNDLKPDREARDAALFSLGMSQVLDAKVFFAPHESADHDFVAMCVVDETQHFIPVQLKELSRHQESVEAGLQDLFASLSKYAPSTTVLAVLLNLPGRIDVPELSIPEIPFNELWFFWCAAEDQSKWCIAGDMLSMPRRECFPYPEP